MSDTLNPVGEAAVFPTEEYQYDERGLKAKFLL